MLVPGKPADPVQFIDVRDLAEFMVRMSESENAGIYNVVGPSSEMGIHACVHGIHAAVSSPVEWVSIPDYEFLKSHGVSYIVPWIMPEGSNVGSARVDASRAQAAGLTFRPLAKTSADVLEWWYSDAITDERRASLTDQDGGLFSREHAIIQAWRRR